MTTATAKKTMTVSQMRWNLKKGFAWADDANMKDDEAGSGLGDIFWTREGGYMWNVDGQNFVMEL